MTDLFEEVEEQLRSERYTTLVRKALPWVLGLTVAFLVVFFGVWGWRQHQAQLAAQASEQYAAGLDALSQGQKDKAAQAFTQVSQSAPGAYKSLALLQLGGLKLVDGQASAAVKLFDQAADAAPDNFLGDAARLKSALALLDTAPEKELESRLTPLTQDGRPYRISAREALGFAKLMAGDESGARTQFVLISQSLDATDGVRERAKAAMDLIDSGSAKAIPSVVKAAASLPPPALPAPGQLPTAPQPQAPGPQ